MPLVSRVARARCNALFTEAMLESRSSATSFALHRNTSQSTNTARCRGGRCCRAATKASRIDSRSTARSAGSASGATRLSGIGSIHVASGRVLRFAASGDRAGPRSIGRALEHIEANVGRDAIEP